MSRKARRMAKEKKERKSSKKKIIFMLVELILVIVMIVAGYNIYNWWKENKENEEALEKISEAVIIEENNENPGESKIKIDFNKLKETNDEVVGWLKVNGTNVEYPVVQGKNNDFYLNHNLEKNYNSAGWIFMDYKNKLDGTDKNIVIYGHNRKNDSMFGTVKNILNPEWYNNEENYKIKFFTEDEESLYEVFSVYKIEAEDYYIKTNFSGKQFKDFVRVMKARSIKNFGVDVTEDDQVLTLSTCADDMNYRIVLHAKKVVNENQENEEIKENTDI